MLPSLEEGSSAAAPSRAVSSKCTSNSSQNFKTSRAAAIFPSETRAKNATPAGKSERLNAARRAVFSRKTVPVQTQNFDFDEVSEVIFKQQFAVGKVAQPVVFVPKTPLV